jgi:3-keto-5-aminohexanoate cleavage enzyme
VEPLIIEARVNEYATRHRNKNVPWLPHEIAGDAAECFSAGASIVHFHGRGADGSPDNQFETCRDTIRAIRETSPILTHPSLGYLTVGSSATERFANTRRLAANPATRPDLAPLDMGSVNADLCDPRTLPFRSPGTVYVNGTDMLIDMSQRMRDVQIKPALVAWNVSFLRLIEAFTSMKLLDAPLFVSLVLTDQILIAGHPGTLQGLEAYLAFLPKDVPVAWAVTYIGGRLDDFLLDRIILAGGHLQVGLGDYTYADHGYPTNADVVARVAERAKALGRAVASPDDTRRILGLPPAGQLM